MNTLSRPPLQQSSEKAVSKDQIEIVPVDTKRCPQAAG
ncbi:Uncharacterised protein [Vibrio cholerae]|nr:Uncharacterised protein [Vibrio cholerae]